MKDIKNSIIDILKECYDPELPIDLWNLGLIYDLHIYEQPKERFGVDITMSLTTPGCSMGQYMIDDIKNKITELKYMDTINVEITFDPPWSPEMMTEEGKQKLGLKYGKPTTRTTYHYIRKSCYTTKKYHGKRRVIKKRCSCCH